MSGDESERLRLSETRSDTVDPVLSAEDTAPQPVWRPLRPLLRTPMPSPLFPALAVALAGCALSWSQGAIRVASDLLLFAVVALAAGGANVLAAVFVRTGSAQPSHIERLRFKGLSLPPIPWLASAGRAGIAGYTCIVLSLVLGLILALHSSLLMIPLGLAGLVGALTYRLPGYAWADQPWAEAVALLLMGPVIVLVADLAQTGSIQGLALSLSIPLGLLAAATLFSVHFCLLDSELSTAARALARYLGLRRSQLLLAAAIALAYLWITVLGGHRGLHGLLLAWFSLPAAVVALSSAFCAAAPRARSLIARPVARLHLSFTLWLAAGLLLDGVVPWLIAHWPHVPL